MQTRCQKNSKAMEVLSGAVKIHGDFITGRDKMSGKLKAETLSALSALVYYSLLPFIYLVSLLPFRALYFFSDLLRSFILHVVKYRKKIVLQNLRNSFPEKSEMELEMICSDFYRNLCDFFLEVIKTITIDKKNLLNRCKFDTGTLELFSKFADANQSVIMVMGHMGNWEWACNSFNTLCRQQLYVIYHPLSNKHFDRLMYRIRTRNGTKLIPMKNTYKEMVINKNGLNATAFVADQTPKPDHAYWTTFLNQDTPTFKGAEAIAKKMNLPVVYASVKKIKRGHYEMVAEILVENPVDTYDGEISEMFTKRLEQDIISQPESWLWSHRRWKHRRSKAEAAISN